MKIDECDTCLWHFGSQLDIHTSNGKRVECRNKDKCSKVHRNITSITKKEAKIVVSTMNDGKLKNSFDTKVNSTNDFKISIVTKK